MDTGPLAGPPVPALVKDINGDARPEFAREFVEFQGRVFFTAQEGFLGPQLWSTDGTAGGTRAVKTLSPGAREQRMGLLTRVGARLFFVLSAPSGTGELWTSDGTEAGTVRVMDFGTAGGPGFAPRELEDLDGTLYLLAAGAEQPWQLWKSDGTGAGTVLVTNLQEPSAPANTFRELRSANGRLFFLSDLEDEPYGFDRLGLWTSDGTRSGTVRLREFPAQLLPTAEKPSLTEFEGQVLLAHKPKNGVGELWRSDGTAAGTRRVQAPFATSWNPMAWRSDHRARAGQALFFMAWDDAHGLELWKSDGSDAGTVLVKDILPGAEGLVSPALWSARDTVFFQFSEGDFSTGFWTSDGTEAGTLHLRSEHESYCCDAGKGFLSMNGVFYAAIQRTYSHGAADALWRSDGTGAGTGFIKVSWPGDINARMGLVASVGGRLLFTRQDPLQGEELWSTDGTVLGTTLVRSLHTDTRAASPYELTDVNGTLYFLTPQTNGYSQQLWRTDGSAAGTQHVIAYHSRNRVLDAPRQIRAVNGVVYVVNDEEVGAPLWRTDGTGTIPLTSGGFWVEGDMVPVNNTLLFPGDGNEGSGLWKSDGTVSGTVMVKRLTPEAWRIHFKCFTAVRDELFFSVHLYTSYSSQGSWALWKSDGTEAGTVLVKDFGPNVFESGPCTLPETTLEGQDTVLLTVHDGSRTTLWKSDGTGEGTVPVWATGTPGQPLAPEGFARMEGTVFFSARGAAGQELWKTDGTARGTVLVKDIHPSGDSSPRSLTKVNDTLFFVADDGTHGAELWKTDGTARGTVLVKDIRPGAQGSQASALFDSEGVLLLSADDGIHGEEPWSSRGTDAETRLLADLFPGEGSSSPKSFTRSGAFIYFQATEPRHGAELWKMSPMRMDAPPELTCPQAPEAAEATEAGGAKVTYPPATVRDDVSAREDVVLQYSPASGSFFPTGSTQVTVTATDGAGNTSTCSFQVVLKAPAPATPPTTPSPPEPGPGPVPRPGSEPASTPDPAPVAELRGCSVTADLSGAAGGGLMLLAWLLAHRRQAGAGPAHRGVH